MSNDAQAAFEQAKLLLDEKKFAEAIALFKRATRLAPNVADYHGWYAQALNENKQYDNALHEGTAVELDSQYGKGFRQRGYAYRILKKFPDAINDYTKAIDIDGKDGSAYKCRGEVYLELNEYDKSVNDLTMAAQITPKERSVYWYRSDAFFKKRDWENYLLDILRYHALDGGVREFSTSRKDFSNDDVQFIQTINQHFENILSQKIKLNNENVVDYYPAHLIIWGRQDKQVFVNGASFNQQLGIFGQGYICITNKNLHIISIGELSRKVDKSMKRPLGFLKNIIPSGDKTVASKKDEYWGIANPNIKAADVFQDPIAASQSVRILTELAQWDIYPFYDNHLQLITIAVNMAKGEKFADVWASKVSTDLTQPSEKAEIINLLKELGKLREMGILSESEFESKKKELLARI